MKTYAKLTLQETIDALRALPTGAEVIGMSGYLHSDRGSYQESAASPNDYPIAAATLASDLAKEIGTTMTGWKGGDYIVRADLPVHVADYGDMGPYIAGFEQGDDGIYRIVGIDQWS